MKFFLLFLAFLLPAFVYAELPPPTTQEQTVYFCDDGVEYGSPGALCAVKAGAQIAAWNAEWAAAGGSAESSPYAGLYPQVAGGPGNWGCDAPPRHICAISERTTQVKFCQPAHSHATSDNQCLCDAGYAEKNGVCEVTDAAKCQAQVGKTYWANVGSTLPVPGVNACAPISGANCAGKITGGACAIKDGARSCEGYITFDGQPCTAETSEEASKELPDCQSGQNSVLAGEVVCKPSTGTDWSNLPQCQQYQKSVDVSGNIVCRPDGNRNTVTSYDKKTESTPNSDGTTTEKETVTRTDCYGDRCVKTDQVTTTVVDADGNRGPPVTTTNPTTPPEDKSSFCVQNPDASICRRSSVTANCTSFSCDGDAVQCAIAREVYSRNCKLWEKDSNPNAYEDAIAGNDPGDIEKMRSDAHANAIQLPTTLDFAGKGWSRVCPADPVIPLGFASGDITLPFSKLCLPLVVASDVAVLLTALGCVVWVVGKS